MMTCGNVHRMMTCGNVHSMLTCGNVHSMLTCGNVHSMMICGNVHSMLICGNVHSMMTCGNLFSTLLVVNVYYSYSLLLGFAIVTAEMAGLDSVLPRAGTALQSHRHDCPTTPIHRACTAGIPNQGCYLRGGNRGDVTRKQQQPPSPPSPPSPLGVVCIDQCRPLGAWTRYKSNDPGMSWVHDHAAELHAARLLLWSSYVFLALGEKHSPCTSNQHLREGGASPPPQYPRGPMARRPSRLGKVRRGGVGGQAEGPHQPGVGGAPAPARCCRRKGLCGGSAPARHLAGRSWPARLIRARRAGALLFLRPGRAGARAHKTSTAFWTSVFCLQRDLTGPD
jgi:hypothetical protein